MHRTLAMVVICGSFLGHGCSGKKELDQFQIELTPAVGHANSMRSLIASLQQQFRSEGLPGLKTELQTLSERLEEFVDENIGEAERPTYQKIVPKLTKLSQVVVVGNPTRADIAERLQELESLALSLPAAETPPAKPAT
jgi:hypothetical protein